MSSFTKFNAGISIKYLGKDCQDNTKLIWKLNEGFEYYLEDNHTKYIRVPKGFITDGASVPKMFWNLLPPWGEYGQAAVLHDYLLESGLVVDTTTSIASIVDRSTARRHFNDAMKVLEVSYWRRKLMIAGVWVLDQWRKIRPIPVRTCSNYDKYPD